MATSDKLNRLLQTKIDLKNAINEKGGSITDKTVFSDYANAVRNLKNGSSDLIDVSELPSTVDDSKIYRQKEATYATCYIAIDQYGVLAVYEIGKALSLTSGESISVNYEVVDKLPATGNVFGENDYTVYVVKNTAIGYVYNNAWYDLATFASTVEQSSFENKGEIESIANITEVGIYTIYAQKTVIGIPNADGEKEASFWNGSEWGSSGNIVVINNGAPFPDVGIEGAIYIRNNVPCLKGTFSGGAKMPYLEFMLFGLGGSRPNVIHFQSSKVPTSFLQTDEITILLCYVPTETGYDVYCSNKVIWSSAMSVTTDPTQDVYVAFRNEVWYYRNSQYVRISPDEIAPLIANMEMPSGKQYVGDLYAITASPTKKEVLQNGFFGEITKDNFFYDSLDWDYYSMRTGALAGNTKVTSIEPFRISNYLNNATDVMNDAVCYGCTGLTVVDIEASKIGKHAFYGCTNLHTVYIYQANIGEYAFANCTSLTDIHYNGTKAEWNAGTFGRGWNENTGNYTVHCTDGNINK